jgi:hypothetical protein
MLTPNYIYSSVCYILKIDIRCYPMRRNDRNGALPVTLVEK